MINAITNVLLEIQIQMRMTRQRDDDINNERKKRVMIIGRNFGRKPKAAENIDWLKLKVRKMALTSLDGALIQRIWSSESEHIREFQISCFWKFDLYPDFLGVLSSKWEIIIPFVIIFLYFTIWIVQEKKSTYSLMITNKQMLCICSRETDWG